MKQFQLLCWLYLWGKGSLSYSHYNKTTYLECTDSYWHTSKNTRGNVYTIRSPLSWWTRATTPKWPHIQTFNSLQFSKYVTKVLGKSLLLLLVLKNEFMKPAIHYAKLRRTHDLHFNADRNARKVRWKPTVQFSCSVQFLFFYPLLFIFSTKWVI